MARRLTLGPILILALLALMWLDEAMARAGWPAGVIVLGLGTLACARGGYELARIFNHLGIQASIKGCTFSAAAGVLAGGLSIGHECWVGHNMGGTVLATSGAAVVFLSMLAYIRDRDLKGAATAVAAAAFAFIYAGVVLGFLLAIRREHGVWTMVGLIFLVKACDSGAYFTGVAIGKHKLIPWISPGKTWEGLVGGVITSGAFGALGVWLLRATMGEAATPALTYTDGVVLGVLLGVIGQAGDLSASVLKRDAGIKDAGRILPGFGGVLDMLDSLLLAAPVGYWYLLLRGF
ncbi:MAG: phosphatidate cytidylyltransferase [Phycisphaerales bacterium]|jgi:phosphatidate cytidylyltransferase|nr:phosphatidate cytidylyltransferase [Phycisphaeraceae bacterium]